MPKSVLDTLNLNYARTELTRKNKMYDLYWSYYLGVAYKQDWVKLFYRLYAGIREFYSLISRSVDLDVQLVPGGWVVTPTTAQDAVNVVLEDSDWRVNGGLMVHNGAVCGDFYIKCVEANGIRSIQPLDTRGVWLEPERVVILRNLVDIYTGVMYEYGEVDDGTSVSIYRDGELVDQYEHSFGAVPVLYGQNKNVGLLHGLNAFSQVLDEVNAVNEMATLMEEAGIRAINAQKVVSGASAVQMELGPDKTIFLPQGATFDTVDMKLEVGAMLTFLQDVYNKARSNLPEMIFDILGNEKGALFSPSRDSLEFVSQELATKIRRMRLGYDSTLARAVNLCDPIIGTDWSFDVDRPVLDLKDAQKPATPELAVPETPTAPQENMGNG
jgi:hypothetical protein